MAYPDNVTELTDGVPADGIAAATPLGSVSYPMDDWARSVATTLEAIQTQITGAYTSYTPTLTALTTPPTLGTGGTTAGYYKRLGRRVWGRAVITFGSGSTNAGSGYYGLLLPVVPADYIQPIGIGFAFNDADQDRFIVASLAIIPVLWAASTSKAVLLQNNVAGEGFATGDNPFGDASPWAWGAGDQIAVSFDYEAAAAS